MKFYTTVQDFTNVYKEQPFMESLHEGCFWMDGTQISGTDCYCDDDAQTEIRKWMATLPQDCPGVHFFDNGNYHYMSKLWTDTVKQPFELIIFDHHPDMQPPRFEGILSCGGWVKEVLDHNEFVQNVALVGVKDSLIDDLKKDPMAEFEKYASRVRFITESEVKEGILRQPLQGLSAGTPIYISIDKDALNVNEAATNWDQGSLTYTQLENILLEIFNGHQVLGVDICGERAKDSDFGNTADADILNNDLNQKLYRLIQTAWIK